MTQIRKAAVVGAGNMGSGIAQKIATEGLPVVLLDMNQAGLDRGMTIIKTLLNQGVERKLFTPQQVEAILGRITASTDFNLAKDCDVVVEAVFEDLKVKREVFAKLDAICPPNTILGTNTSSFYVKDLMPGLRHPQRVVGLHYFFHPAKNRLVEVIGGEGSSAEAVTRAWTFNEMIGKTPIHSKDAPGFVVNRYFVPWLNEAVRLLEEKVADIPTIEAAAKEAFRIGMGPFELMNVTGVPISLHAATTLGNQFGAFYAPAALLRKQVESKQNWDLSGTPDASKSAAVAERLLAVTFQVAGSLVDEGVASIEDADIGARVGLRWSMGPFEIMNRQGLPKARAMVQALIAKYKDLKMPQCIAKQGDNAFVFRLVRLEKKGATATITFNRPDALNALNEEVMKQLRSRFDEAEKDASVTTIVLAGAGKAFVAGADIRYFVKKIEAKKVADIEAFTKAGQDLFRDIDNSKKFVIVRLDGLSLGGGSELVLCADSVIATAKGSMGFPETGIGIYPGLGGTQRLSRQVGPALAKWLVYSGDMVDAKTALELGLVQKVVEVSEIEKTIEEAAKNPVAFRKSAKTPEVPAKFAATAKLFEATKAEAFLKGAAAAAGADEKLAKIASRVSRKAPVALKLAEKLIDEGSKISLDEGLKMELSHLNQIFSTKDAYEGLSTLGKKKPEWVGS